MFLEIITPDKTLFKGKILRVKIPGKSGSFEILKNHAPIISLLEKGTIRVIDEDKRTHKFKVEGGVVENKGNKIVVLLEETL